jgi:hypothetical protein
LEGPNLGRRIKIKEDIREIEWVCVEWIHLSQGLVEGCCEHNNELLGSIKCWKFLE